MDLPEQIFEQAVGDPYVKTENFNKMVRILRWIGAIMFNRDHFITDKSGGNPVISLVPSNELPPKDQFMVLESGNEIQFRGGVCQFIEKVWNSGGAEYHDETAVYEPENGAEIIWAGESDHQDALSDFYEITETCQFWAKLDRTSTPEFTIVKLTAAPTADKDIEWVKIWSCTFADDAITDREQHHTGSIDMAIWLKDAGSTTNIQRSGDSVDSTTWRSRDDKALSKWCFRSYMGTDYLKVFRHEIQVDQNGDLLYVGGETEAYSLTLTELTVVTQVRYDTSGHTLDYKNRTGYVINAGAESGWTTFATAAECDTP